MPTTAGQPVSQGGRADGLRDSGLRVARLLVDQQVEMAVDEFLWGVYFLQHFTHHKFLFHKEFLDPKSIRR